MTTMSFSELINSLKKVPIFEERVNTPKLREFVVSSDHITSLHTILTQFFGDSFKAPGYQPSPAHKKLAAMWGGIRDGQTLYFRQEGELNSCAMFWPWQDGTRCTVKLARW